MAKHYTDHFKENTFSTTGVEPVVALEITHLQLAVPIRIVNDTQDIVIQGNTYTAFSFSVTLPDDLSQNLPTAPITIDNIGRELTQWLELSNGGKGAKVRIIQVMRDTPNIIEQEYTLDLLSVTQGMLTITGQLGFQNLLEQPCLMAGFTPETTPELF